MQETEGGGSARQVSFPRKSSSLSFQATLVQPSFPMDGSFFERNGGAVRMVLPSAAAASPSAGA